MDIYNIFPTPVHVFKAEFDFKKIISDLEEEDYINVNQAQPEHPERVWQTRHDLHKDPRFKEITNFFEDCVEQYRAHYEYECEKLDISIMWANLSPGFKAGKHEIHHHPMSYVSGIFYLTDGSPTMFCDPVDKRREGMIKLYSVDPQKTPEQWGMIPEAGKLLLFPSWLKHGTLNHVQEFARWSISFNCIPIGPCNAASSQAKLATWNLYQAE